MLEDKKILVLSVSAWSEKSGADTWPTLVGQFHPNNIASISLREETPDSLASNNYFVVSENRVIKSIFKRSIKTGYKVKTEQNQEQNSQDLSAHNSRYKKMRKRRGFWGLSAREVVWKLGKWKSKELKDFLLEFNPDIILYSMDGYIHFNRICRYAKKLTRAKSIGFFVDDNFTYKQTNKTGLKFFRFFQRRSLKKLAKKTDAFWAITDMTKKEADEFFNVDCTVVTKPLNRTIEYTDWQVNAPIKMVYTGNLSIGRDKSLLKVVNALKEINRQETKIVLDVYSKTVLDEKTSKELDRDFCTFHGAVLQKEVFDIQQGADILLFLEDVDGEDAKTARLSFSTKITDYLSCGKCIFAVGCLDTAPMKYMQENDIAIVATETNQIIQELTKIELDKNILKEYAKRACECGERNHNKEKILTTVRESLEKLFKED